MLHMITGIFQKVKYNVPANQKLLLQVWSPMPIGHTLGQCVWFIQRQKLNKLAGANFVSKINKTKLRYEVPACSQCTCICGGKYVRKLLLKFLPTTIIDGQIVQKNITSLTSSQKCCPYLLYIVISNFLKSTVSSFLTPYWWQFLRLRKCIHILNSNKQSNDNVS